MKKKIYGIILLLFCMCMPAWSQQYVVTSLAEQGQTCLKVSESEIVFGNTAASKIISVKANSRLFLQVDADWCTAVAKGNDVLLSVTANSGNENRMATLSVRLRDGVCHQIPVRQLGSAPIVHPSVTELTVTDAEEFILEVASTVVPTFQCPDWITLKEPAPTAGTISYHFLVQDLGLLAERTGQIVVGGQGAQSVTVTVHQTTERYPSFAVISDIHLGNTMGSGPLVKVPRALKYLTAQKKLDAIFVVGDLANAGKVDEYEQVVSVFTNDDNFTNPVARKVFMMGNHDNYSGLINYTKGLSVFNGGENYPYDQYMVIKGYPFITISCRSGVGNDDENEASGLLAYPKEVQDTLKKWLARAEKECPGKPIFVFTHIPPKYTCYSSWPGEGDGNAPLTWSVKSLNPILNQYPQAVVFAGHGHYPLGDPRSIHQGVDPKSIKNNYYTVINTGSTTYCEIEKPAVDEGGYPEGYHEVTEGLIVNVQPSGDVEVRRYDTNHCMEIHADARWMLKSPWDGSAFTYADKRDLADAPAGASIRDGKPAPAFGSGATVSVSSTESGLLATFPQATDNDVVFRYKAQLLNDKGYSVEDHWIFSGYFRYPEMPAEQKVTFTMGKGGETYTVAITAYDSYDNPSETIRSEEFKCEGLSLPDPIGYWDFSNSSDLLKNSASGSLKMSTVTVDNGGYVSDKSSIDDAGMSLIEGPGKNALSVPANSALKVSGVPNMDSYTIMMEFRCGVFSGYNALFQADAGNSTDADLCIRAYDRMIGPQALGYAGNFTADEWHRLVLVVNNQVATSYLDGQYLSTSGSANDRWSLSGGNCYFFCDEDGELADNDVSVLAMWPTALSAAQVASLGSTASEESLSVSTTEINLYDEKEFQITVSGNVEPVFTCPEWIHLLRPVPAIGKATYTFMVDKYTEIGTRVGSLIISGPEGSDVEPIEVIINQTYSGENVPEAKGRWTFDDPDDLLANFYDNSCYLESGNVDNEGTISWADVEEAGIETIEGPTADNKAIHLPVDAMFHVITEALSEKPLTNFSIMYDVRMSDWSGFNALFQNDLENKIDAGFCMNTNKQIGLNVANWGYGGKIIPGRWHRILFVVKDGIPNAYLDGVLVNAGVATSEHWSLDPNGFYLFCDDDGERQETDVAELCYWDEVLTAEQISQLGPVDYPYVYVPITSYSLYGDNLDFSIETESSVVPEISTSDWIKAVDVTPGKGTQVYAFRAEPMQEIGTREGFVTFTADGAETVTVKVTQENNGTSVPSADGCWTFDDESDMFKSTEGDATLIPVLVDQTNVTPFEVPSEAAGALVEGPVEGKMAMQLSNGIGFYMKLNEESPLSNYTVMMDIQYPPLGTDIYTALMQFNLNNTDDADLFIRNKAGVYQVGKG
ncbi:MAG: metallophosphoesterase, partial [Bacteroidaceae bacterium]